MMDVVNPHSGWNWQWPTVGGTPISQGFDTEIFDTVEVPHAETFVREAIQNSLDARLDLGKPVRIAFNFHNGQLGPRRAFLEGLNRPGIAGGRFI